MTISTGYPPRGKRSTYTRTPYTIVNNTSADLRAFDAEIMDSLSRTGRMPDELADLIVAKRAPIAETRWILDWK